MTTLYVRENDGFRQATAGDVFERARALTAARLRQGSPVLNTPAHMREFLSFRLAGLEHEVFGVLFLDATGRLIAGEDMFRGTVNGASVYAREVVKAALAHNAAKIILFHNHPSGSVAPSEPDRFITTRLREALEIVDVQVIDHLIVGDGVYSFAENGEL